MVCTSVLEMVKTGNIDCVRIFYRGAEDGGDEEDEEDVDGEEDAGGVEGEAGEEDGLISCSTWELKLGTQSIFPIFFLLTLAF